MAEEFAVLDRAGRLQLPRGFTDPWDLWWQAGLLAAQAQAVRVSKSDADNAFWERYKNFAGTAEAYCNR